MKHFYNVLWILFGFLLCTFSARAQSYPPAADQPGSTAIPAESDLFVSWATGVEIVRGPVDISTPDSAFASHGIPENALGAPSNNVVSLGDGGEAILTFDHPIMDGPGFDFAVFENGFDDGFLELAFVEISSNGTDFFRFPSHSLTQTHTQVAAFDQLDPTKLHNLAGKYRVFFGTPFDISEVENHPLLDKNNITHVKIIDVVGSIDPEFATYDSYGNIINDPFTTPFASGGFDLDAVGVIHQNTLGTTAHSKIAIKVFPNPATHSISISGEAEISEVQVFDAQGKFIVKRTHPHTREISVHHLKPGIYFMKIRLPNSILTEKIIVQ